MNHETLRSQNPFFLLDRVTDEQVRKTAEIGRKVLRPVSELIEGQQPTPIQYDPESPLNELYVRLGSGRCLECGDSLENEDWAPWCTTCYQRLDDTGFFQP